MVKNENLVSTKSVKYSTADLNEIQENIANIIEKYFTEEEYQKVSFSLSASFSKQKIILEHNQLPEPLIAQILETFKDILQVENINNIVSPTKARTENFNELGSGIGISISNNGDTGTCTIGAIAKKNGTYFAVTAGHCFKGTISPTGYSGNLVKQYTASLGRQHISGNSGYDVGLVRITTESAIKRYATNKIKRWVSGEYAGVVTHSVAIFEGMPVCKSGLTTSTTCGTITIPYTTVKYEDWPRFNVAEIEGTGFTDEGDSGGPVYFNPVNSGNAVYLVGIVSGKRERNSTITHGFMTRFNDIESLYDISIYNSSTILPLN